MTVVVTNKRKDGDLSVTIYFTFDMHYFMLHLKWDSEVRHPPTQSLHTKREGLSLKVHVKHTREVH